MSVKTALDIGYSVVRLLMESKTEILLLSYAQKYL